MSKKGKKANVVRWNESVDGTLNEVNIREKFKRMGIRAEKHVLQPGTDFPEHTHETEKKDAILSGGFKIKMFGVSNKLKPGDFIDIPANAVHSSGVVGKETVIFFDGSM